jgi:hypothetical protein
MLRVARSENLVAELLQLIGDADNARAHYRSAVELLKGVIGRDPKNMAALELLTMVEKKIETPLDPNLGESLRACTSS